MKKTVTIIAIILIIAGAAVCGIALATNGFSLKKLSNTKYETKTFEVSDSFDSISVNVDTEDVTFEFTKDNSCKVECYADEKQNYDVDVKSGTLNISRKKNSRKWYENLSIITEKSKITVYIPEKDYSDISVEIDTGDILISDMNCNSMTLRSDTGDLNLTDIRSEGSLEFSTDTGDIVLKNVISDGTFDFSTDTGDITLDKCDASDIIIKTDTGDVTGSLLSDKKFKTKSDTGEIRVPDTENGGKCTITTDTGDIKISIAD